MSHRTHTLHRTLQVGRCGVAFRFALALVLKNWLCGLLLGLAMLCHSLSRVIMSMSMAPDVSPSLALLHHVHGMFRSTNVRDEASASAGTCPKSGCTRSGVYCKITTPICCQKLKMLCGDPRCLMPTRGDSNNYVPSSYPYHGTCPRVSIARDMAVYRPHVCASYSAWSSPCFQSAILWPDSHDGNASPQ